MGMFQAVPTLNVELAAWRRGHRCVAGVDEVGRGPLAGPLVAGAVILEPDLAQSWWCELRDSKMLDLPERVRLASMIRDSCAYGIGLVSHEHLDRVGLIAATKLAMRRALAALPCRPDLVLIDAVSLPEYRHRAIIHGDALCASIAAGSIVAKVARDAMMADLHPSYPQYGFDHNRGYMTPEHMSALGEHGPCAIHRRLFAPVRAACEAHGMEVETYGLAAEPAASPPVPLSS